VLRKHEGRCGAEGGYGEAVVSPQEKPPRQAHPFRIGFDHWGERLMALFAHSAVAQKRRDSVALRTGWRGNTFTTVLS
jgi:hypothetical protein